ncbi:DUF5667 domain-containing protein [Cytobacillus sp.]|uniref:DUF5667 domain-containing protein n=1 Tax=Cytobacillus sp. TaxID=2675269 RepID=UPI0028BD682D|nr:DUF5667 domain-containing protein [Cytobacillus sp.]
MKFLSNKELQKLGRTTLAWVLAGTFTFSTTLASAAENTNETDQYETVDLPDNLDVPKVNPEQAKGEKVENEAPSLLPGSFFYFAKIALEKIKLAFTFNEEKEAKLLAAFAAERLAEAEALFKEGKEDEALEAIKHAFESLENVESIIGEEGSVDNAAEAEEKTERDDSKADESETDVKSEEVDVEEDADVDKLLSQNIIALTAAMEKVKNPKAKAALQKNIEKSYAKIALKIEKMEKKDLNKDLIKDHEAIEESTTSTALPVDKNLTVNMPAEKNAKVKEEVTKVELEDDALPVKQKIQEKAVQRQEKKATHEEAKIQKALIKEESKNTRKIEKQEIKENKKALKEEKKLEKDKGKQKEKEQEKKGNH